MKGYTMKRLLPLLLALMLFSACAFLAPRQTPAPVAEITPLPTETPQERVLLGKRSEDGAMLDLSLFLNTDGFVTWQVFFTREGLGVFQINTAARRYRVGAYDLYTGELEIRYEDDIQPGEEGMEYYVDMECLSTDPLVLHDYIGQTYILFDETLRPLRIMPVGALGAYDHIYSVDKDCLYYINSRQELKLYNTSTGESVLLDIPVPDEYAYIKGLYENGNVLVLSYWDGGAQVDRFYDMTTQEPLPYSNTDDLTIWNEGDDYAYANHSEASSKLYFAKKGAARGGSWLRLEKEAELYNARVLFSRGIVFTSLSDFDGTEDEMSLFYTLKRYDLSLGLQTNTLRFTRRSDGGDYGLHLNQNCYNDDLGLCCFAVPGAFGEGLVALWDTSVQGEVNNDLSMDNRIESRVFGDLPDNVYAYARMLADYYGVNIYTGEDAVRDFPDYTAAPVTDVHLIRQALEALEEVLELYPEGFFRQLTYGEIRSVDIYLCGGLKAINSYNLDDCDAFAVVHDNQQMMVINIERTYGLRGTLCHELSHVIDHKLEYAGLFSDVRSLDEKIWQSLNPPGFRYFYSYLDENGDSYSWLPIYEYTPAAPEATGDVDHIYFVDTYSMTFPTEDRARIMEYCMQEEVPYYFESVHLLAKLHYYSQTIRVVFDTAGWPEYTVWERALRE